MGSKSSVRKQPKPSLFREVCNSNELASSSKATENGSCTNFRFPQLCWRENWWRQFGVVSPLFLPRTRYWTPADAFNRAFIRMLKMSNCKRYVCFFGKIDWNCFCINGLGELNFWNWNFNYLTMKIIWNFNYLMMKSNWNFNYLMRKSNWNFNSDWL